jgi:hypothetical protein
MWLASLFTGGRVAETTVTTATTPAFATVFDRQLTTDHYFTKS